MENYVSFEELQKKPVTIEQSNEKEPVVDQKFFWNSDRDKLLIELFKKYRSEVGTSEIRTLTSMWKLVAPALSEILKMTVSPNQCQSRWFVLRSSYRKYLVNRNYFGPGRTLFKYTEGVEELFGERRKKHRPKRFHYPSTQDNNVDKEGIEELFGEKSKKQSPYRIVSSEISRSRQNENVDNEVTHESSTVPKYNKIPISTFLIKQKEEKITIQKEKLELERLNLQGYIKRNELMEQYIDLLKKGISICHCKLTDK